MTIPPKIDWNDPNTMDRITVHVGARVLGDASPPPRFRSYKEICSRCQSELWVSPNSLEHSQAIGFEVAFLCLPCFKIVLPKVGDADIILPVPGPNGDQLRLHAQRPDDVDQ
jgi:hypothetical protein